MFLPDWPSRFFEYFSAYCLACFIVSPLFALTGFSYAWVLLAPVTAPAMLAITTAMIGANEVGTSWQSVAWLYVYLAIAVIVSISIVKLGKRHRIVLPIASILLFVYLLVMMRYANV